MANARPPLNDPPAALIQAVAHLLRPLVKLLITFQISYPFLVRLLKKTYVEVAERDFPVPGKRQTDSRIAMLTGVHRKDVRRLRNGGESLAHAPGPASLGAQIVAAWMSEPAYTDARGRPRPLPRFSQHGEPGFDTLVEAVSRQDLRARSVLDEWLQSGIVRIDDHDRVELQVEAFIPRSNFDEKAFFFGMNLHDHIAAAGHNLAGGQPARFERNVYYNHLTAESMTKLDNAVNRQAMALLKDINRQARELQRRDRGKKGATGRFNLGVFFYPTQDHESESDNDK